MSSFRIKQTNSTELPSLSIVSSRHGPSLSSLPFGLADATAGTENELQAIVVGKRNTVDLPVTVERSKYFANIARRVAFGEASPRLVQELERFLKDNPDQVWDNSWVRFPRRNLSQFANQLLERDLAGINRGRKTRTDRSRFVFGTTWGDWVRVPISYLVKLALVDVVGRETSLPPVLRETALNLLPNFSNDLTSPETFSFHTIDSESCQEFGKAISKEMATRFLLTHLLVEWSNKILNLESLGQRAAVNLAPHPPVRQRELNSCVSDSFYRDLFVSPCLSGWSDGAAKHEYMLQAHQVISRSQINAALKLREAGIINNNLMVIPNTSSVSLANNGTHLSLGSKVLASHLSDPNSGFAAQDEKALGDLVIKISEHFLPLFVGVYTAAPYRLGFADFHPELALGFLPHELDYSHLRMLWRHWKRKADVRVFGHPLTPYGPKWIDQLLGKAFQLRGDLVTDYRLIDFPVAWLCTETASALNGEPGNTESLKCDLHSMGVSDRNLKLYLPLALREFATAGFSGFEGRHYSLFSSMSDDFAPAADLQRLITMLAYRYALSGQYRHPEIPDDPASESERRLPFFCAAIDLPAFNIRARTENQFLRRIAALTKNSGASRHGGYLRLPLNEYRLALVQLIKEDASDCVEMLGLESMIDDLSARLRNKNLCASHKLLTGVLSRSNKRRGIDIEAREFNLEAERFYRQELKRKFLQEGIEFVSQALKRSNELQAKCLRSILPDLRPSHFLSEISRSLLEDKLTPTQLTTLISLVLLTIKSGMDEHHGNDRKPRTFNAAASIHRSADTACLQ